MREFPGADDRIAQNQSIRPGFRRDRNRRVVPKRPQARRQVPPGRKAEHSDFIRVNMPFRMFAPQDAHGFRKLPQGLVPCRLFPAGILDVKHLIPH
jgi:hypothetical protein